MKIVINRKEAEAIVDVEKVLKSFGVEIEEKQYEGVTHEVDKEKDILTLDIESEFITDLIGIYTGAIQRIFPVINAIKSLINALDKSICCDTELFNKKWLKKEGK